MENFYNLVIEFGNYLLLINNDESKKIFINGSVINHPNKLHLLNFFRMEDETENKSEIVKDDEGLEKIIHKYS